MLSRSISSASTMPMPTIAQSFSRSCSRRRSAAESCFESLMPRGMPLAGRITAAATTGPASGPRPASSTPATGARQSFSCLRLGIGQPPGREASVLAGRVEADGVAGRIGEARLAPQPALLGRESIEGHPGALHPRDLGIKVLALEEQGGPCTGYDRQRGAAGRYEAGIVGVVGADELAQTEQGVEFARRGLSGHADRDLGESCARAEVEPLRLVTHRAMAGAETRSIFQCHPHELPGAHDGLKQRGATAEIRRA